MAKDKLLTPLELLRFRRSELHAWSCAIASQMIERMDTTEFVFKKKKDNTTETLEDTHPVFYLSMLVRIATHLELNHNGNYGTGVEK